MHRYFAMSLLTASMAVATPTAAAEPERVRGWAGEGELGAATLGVAGTRRKTMPDRDPLARAREGRSSWEAEARVALGDFGLTAGAALERRRPAALAADGSSLPSRALAVDFDWARDDRLRLSAGWFSNGPQGARRIADRLAERGGTALPDARGVRFGIASGPLALDARWQRIGAGDAALGGFVSGMSDARIAVRLATYY